MSVGTAENLNSDYRRQPDARNLDHLPGDYGLPILGKTVQFLTDYDRLGRDHVDTYGHVSRINMGGQRGVLVVGPDIMQELLLDKTENFSSEMGYKEQVGRFYGGSFIALDFDEHKIQRRIFQTAFKTEAMKNYLFEMSEIMRSEMSCWESDILFYQKIKALLLGIAVKIFLGEDNYSRDAKKLNKAFIDTSNGLLAIVRKDIPIPGWKFHKGMQGKKFLTQYFTSQIPERRNSDRTDVFSYVCREKKENGNYYSDEEICAHMSLLLFAAHDTTTSTLTNMIYEVSRNRQWQERLREEMLQLSSGILFFEDLDKLKDFDLAFNETLRLHCPVQLFNRRAIRDCKLGGYNIPGNTMVFIAVRHHHRLPEIWSDPERFDPERFNQSRREDKLHAFNFIPFGGGAHKCLGMHFARHLGKAFMFEFLRHYSFSLPENYQVKYKYIPLVKPVDDLPLHIRSL